MNKRLSTSNEYLKKATKVIDNADSICKKIDSNSNCQEYLVNKLNQKNTTTYYLINENDSVDGLCIIETLDKNYGNILLHTINIDDEITLGKLVAEEKVFHKKIYELIQFRTNFNYRDTFITFGYREKERMRMIHSNLTEFSNIKIQDNISFKTIQATDSSICGNISHHAHKYRLHIENYNVYASVDKRAEYSKAIRNNVHGKAIDQASILMLQDNTPIGVVEVVHVENWNLKIGWLMDVSLLPEYQGMGLGKLLVQKCLHELHNCGYKHAGLSVTLTNTTAASLYKDLGFKEKEFFVEIIG